MNEKCPECEVDMILEESVIDTYDRGTEVHTTIEMEYLVCPECGFEYDEYEN